MKHLFAAAAVLALLSGGSAFAQANADAAPAAAATTADATAALGTPPPTYPVCKTRTQDRCREPGQGTRSARAHKTTSSANGLRPFSNED